MKRPGQLRMMCYKVEAVMSVEVWYFLHGTTNGACNLFYFLSLLSKMQTTDTQVGKRGQTYTVKAGQADGSLLGLSREWRIGRKAVRRLLDDFAERRMIAVESNPLTSLISLVCVRSWVIDGRLIENPMFRSAVGKFEGVRIHLLNGQQFGTLRRSSQRVGGGKAGGKSGAVAVDSNQEPEQMSERVSQLALDTSAPDDIHALCVPENTLVLRSEDRQSDSAVIGTVTTSDGTIQQPAEGTTSGKANTDLL